MKQEERPEKKLPEYVDGLPVGEIMRAIRSIRYGDVSIVIQDSKVVQIDKLEKIRLAK